MRSKRRATGPPAYVAELKDSFYSIEAARQLGTSRRNLRRWLQTKRIPAPTGREENGYRIWTRDDMNRAKEALGR